MLTFKQRIQNVIFPLGSIQKIRKGYLKGYRIRLSENSLWSPLIGNWEPAMQKIMMNVVRKNAVVYDLGANNGLHGLLMAGLVGPEGKVYNFEPFPSNIEEINENFKLNNIVNYQNVQAAVSNTASTLHFQVGDHAKQGKITAFSNGKENTVEVQAITLDSFIEAGNPMPAFIKMDIEGAEADALDGFSKNISRCNPELIIELHGIDQDIRVGKFLLDHGYSAYRFDTFKRLQFDKIKDFTKTYPDPSGIWGSIFCIGPGKKLEDYSFEK